MKPYPINLNLKNRKVLIAGAGRVAARKFRGLLETEAEVMIVSPTYNNFFVRYLPGDFNPGDSFQKIIATLICTFKNRKFKKTDLKEKFLVIAATDNSAVNEKIAVQAKAKNILVNVVDQPELSDFNLPASTAKGDLLLTVSTGASLPALSKAVKEELAQNYGIEYQLLLQVMMELRPEIIAQIADRSLRKEIFKSLASAEFLRGLKNLLLRATEAGEQKPEGDIISADSDLYLEVKNRVIKLVKSYKGDFSED